MVPMADDEFWAARGVSLAAYLGTVGLVYAAARDLMPGSRTVAVVAALVAIFLPQFAFTSAYLNKDALAAFEGTAMCALLVRIWRVGPHIGLVSALGVVLGAMLLTRYTAYAIAVVGLLTGIALVVRGRRPWLGAAALLASVGFSSGWWFWRNVVLYGEVIPAQVMAQAKELAGGNSLFVPADHGINLLTLSTQTEFWEVTLQSFVGVFGFLSIFLDPVHYAACAIAAVTAVVGLILASRRGRPVAAGRGVGLVAAAGTLGTVASAMAISTYGEFSAQGRYLFPALAPIVVALAAGWYWLSEAQRRLRWLPAAPVGGLILLNLISLFGYVVPQEFGTSSARIFVQIDHPSGAVSPSEEIEVLGWSFLEGDLAWHPYTLTPVTEYRRPVDGVRLYLDGRPGEGRDYGAADYGFARPDVRDFYGGNPRLEPVGFRLVVPPGVLASGTHQLYVCATLAPAAAPVCAQREIVVR
jgi:4-amino-4-deoxy-L-arabinose transferase-like glycosyltransferase